MTIKAGDKVIVHEGTEVRFRDGKYEATVIEAYNDHEFLVEPVVKLPEDKHKFFALSEYDEVIPAGEDTCSKLLRALSELRSYCGDGVPGRHYPSGLPDFLDEVEPILKSLKEVRALS